MKTYTSDELKEICLKHIKWLRNEEGGGRADLQGANLQGADLRRADLRRADLQGANLYGADLYGADLQGADLRGADLRRADLQGANLQGADLRGADLQGANLYGANLYGADLRRADLHGADLQGADLRRAKNAELARAQTVIVPAGSLIGWKKCKTSDSSRTCIVKLRIPEDAKRSNATGRKCRAERVEVLEIFPAVDDAVSMTREPGVAYRVGATVTCDGWDDNRFNECSGGIHFFITREEAESWT